MPDAPPGRYSHSARSPIVWVRLCPTCAGYAPGTPSAARSGDCAGCGARTYETHRFAAYIDSAAGCSCGTHGRPVMGDIRPRVEDVPDA